MAIFILLTEVKFEPVTNHKLMAAGRGAMAGACGVFVAVTQIKVLEFGGHGGDYGIVPAVAQAETEELVISSASGQFPGVESKVGLH